MEDIRILWSVSRSNAQIGAISIGPDVYYIYFGPGLPKIIDANMKPLVLSNIDNWIIAKTRHRYSLRSLQDMVESYLEGARSAYSEDDVRSLIARCTDLTIKRLCRSELLDDVNKLYWVESASAISIQNLIGNMRADFDKYKSNLGEDAFYNILCRMYKTCNLRQFDGADSIAALASRLGRSINDPKYPSLDDITSKILQDIISLTTSEQLNHETDLVLKSMLD